jgi:hypothetical protein
VAVQYQRHADVQAEASREGHHDIGDLLGSIRIDDPAAGVTMGNSGTGIEQPQIVVDLRNCTHRRSRISGVALLTNGKRGTDTDYVVDIRAVDPFQELAGVCRERGHIPALTFRVESIEGKAALATAGHTRNYGQGTEGKFNRNVLQIVNPGACYDDGAIVLLGQSRYLPNGGIRMKPNQQ